MTSLYAIFNAMSKSYQSFSFSFTTHSNNEKKLFLIATLKAVFSSLNVCQLSVCFSDISQIM